MLFNRLSRMFQMKHVNHQIFVLVIVTVTLPLMATSAIIYHFSTQAVKSEYQNSSSLILNNLSFNIDQYLQSIDKSTVNAPMDGQVQRALERWSLDSREAAENRLISDLHTVENLASSIEMTIKNVDSVQVFAGNRIFISGKYNRLDYDATDFDRQAWYLRTLEREGAIAVFGTHMPFHRTNATEPVISIARVINKIGTRQPLGVMLIDIRLDSLREILSLSENSNRNFIIADRDGLLIYSTDPEHIGSAKPFHEDHPSLQTILSEETGKLYAVLANRKSFVNFVTSRYSGWKVLQYIPEDEMTKDARFLRKIILGLAFLSFGMAILFMYILNARVAKPIIQLSKQVKLVGMGQFDVNLRSNRQDEFGVLYQGIRKMTEDLQDIIERSSMAKAQQKVARFGALKSQINPHFLANALETVQMKAVIGGQRELGEMVGLLGRLFRIHIQTGKKTVPLREELAHTRLYVQVQQMRFGDKIRYVERLAEGSDAVQVLHFSLQPLIENAIVHGLEPRSGPGLLEISAGSEGRDLLIAVRDDGVGMDELRLEELAARLNEQSDTLDETHIGIKNVHERIQYYFGEQYGIRIVSRPGEGTNVTIRIPAGETNRGPI